MLASRHRFQQSGQFARVLHPFRLRVEALVRDKLFEPQHAAQAAIKRLAAAPITA